MSYMWALYAREVKRFQKMLLDTVFGPIMSVGLYLAVFGYVAGGRDIQGVNYLTFVYIGLLTMLVINGCFFNPSFALVLGRNVGSIIDLQLAPIKAWKIGMAYALAALTRGLATLVAAIALTIWFIPGFGVHNIWYLLLGLLLTGIEFGTIGVIFGLTAKNFEALTFMTTFVVQPLIFLAGVFFPVSELPGIWSKVALFNPIHHTINLIRYAVLGVSDISPHVSFGIVALVTIALVLTMRQVAEKHLRAQ